MRRERPAAQRLWTPVFGALLGCYAAFTLLDAFVLPHDLVPLVTSSPATEPGGAGVWQTSGGVLMQVPPLRVRANMV